MAFCWPRREHRGSKLRHMLSFPGRSPDAIVTTTEARIGRIYGAQRLKPARPALPPRSHPAPPAWRSIRGTPARTRRSAPLHPLVPLPSHASPQTGRTRTRLKWYDLNGRRKLRPGQEANGDDAESGPGAPQSGESVPMPRAGERAFLGPGHAALHQRVLHANVGRTAGEPHRLRIPEKRILGEHLGRIP